MRTGRHTHDRRNFSRASVGRRVVPVLLLAACSAGLGAGDRPESEGAIGRALVSAGLNQDQPDQTGTARDAAEPLEFFLRDQFDDAGADAGPPLPPAATPTTPRRGIDPSRAWTGYNEAQQLPIVPPPPDEPSLLPIPDAGAPLSGRPMAPETGRTIVRPRVSHDDEDDDAPLRGALSSALCACEAHWVNWRCGSDRLEGCAPEGYNALPIMYSAPAAAEYGGPVLSGGSVEPGGSYDQSVQVSGYQTKSIRELTAAIAPQAGRLPGNPAAERFAQLPARSHLAGTHRDWNGMAYYWSASHLAHQPLYFEDVNLERHGYSFGILQPAVSAARFYATFPLLPYLCGASPPYRAAYTLGESRPGSPAPYVIDYPRPSITGGLLEAAVVTGLFFAVP